MIRRFSPIFHSLRHLSAGPEAKVAVDKALLSKLRKKTGFPLLNCRKALEQFNNDVKQAESWMREQAQKEGWSKASKLEGRPMSQGLVGLLLQGDAATVVEVNCETDFVARNEQFQDLVTQLTKACHQNLSQKDASKTVIAKQELNQLETEGKTFGDLVALRVGSLGENIALRRAAFIRNDPSTILSTFVHASGPQIVKDGCKLGKFAAVLKMEGPNLEAVAGQICQHIVGMNPREIGEWNTLPPEKTDKKKKKKKEGVEEEEKKEEKEEMRLLQQEFLLEPRMTVKGYLQDNAPRVVDFVRLECGEDLGEEEE